MVPIALETYGRVGNRAIKFVRQLAREQTAQVGGDEVWGPHNLIARWGARLSVALHRANAANVRMAASTGGAAARWLETELGR